MDLGDRVCVLLNRQVKRSNMTSEEIERIVGAPVQFAFPNDYSRVARAIQDGQGVDPKSELGKSFDQLSRFMLEKTAAAPELPQKGSSNTSTSRRRVFRLKEPSREQPRLLVDSMVRACYSQSAFVHPAN